MLVPPRSSLRCGQEEGAVASAARKGTPQDEGMQVPPHAAHYRHYSPSRLRSRGFAQHAPHLSTTGSSGWCLPTHHHPWQHLHRPEGNVPPAASPEHHRVAKVGLVAHLFGVHAHQALQREGQGARKEAQAVNGAGWQLSPSTLSEACATALQHQQQSIHAQSAHTAAMSSMPRTSAPTGECELQSQLIDAPPSMASKAALPL